MTEYTETDVIMTAKYLMLLEESEAFTEAVRQQLERWECLIGGILDREDVEEAQEMIDGDIVACERPTASEAEDAYLRGREAELDEDEDCPGDCDHCDKFDPMDCIVEDDDCDDVCIECRMKECDENVSEMQDDETAE